MVDTIDSALRDNNTLGDPGSGDYKVKKGPLRTVLKRIEASAGIGAVAVATKTELDAITDKADNAPGFVVGDSTASNNGQYTWDDSGSAWVKVRDLPDTATILESVAGTNDVTANVATGVNPAAVSLFVLTPTNTNTGAMTLTIEGETAQDFKTYAGDDFASGAIVAGRAYLVFDTGSEYRALNDDRILPFRGAYAAPTTYSLGDLAENGGSIWYSLQDDNTGNTPSEGAYWTEFLPGVTVADGSVTTAKLADNSVTNAKLTAAHSLALSHTVADRTALKALDTARYNVAFVQGVSGGLFVWDSSDLSTEVTADTEEGVYVAPTADATGASGAWVRVIENAINVKWFGAVGDGVTDDTNAIQAALDTGLNIYIPETENGFLVSTLDLLNNQEIRGAGKWKKGLVGDGTGPVLQIGDGTGSIRSNVISRLKIENTGAECINGDFAPNLTIEGCEIRCSGAHAINLKLCYRLIVQDNYILTSGAYTALRALNNCNGGVFFKNTITGGSAGRAIQIGQSQGVRVDNNIIETSLDGIWIASTSDTGDGNCNGVTLTNNYIEQCSTPFVLSKVYTIFGLTMKSNYVGNAATTTIATRVACVQHGRIKGGSITDNAFYLDSGGSEDLLHVYLPLTSANIVDMEWQRNYVENAATNLTKLGTYASNGGANNDVGANSYYDFGDGELPNKRVFISPALKADVSTGDIEWTEIGEYNWGGEIESVEIIDAVGSLTGCNVALGDSANFQVNVSQVDISTLTFTRGKTDLTVAGNSIDTRASGYNRYKVIAGTGTGSFRIKITYRAN
ncbi:right-handed parallel beta-helix repeat-containing protein [Maritalea mobilis]|nr:right-handed parallel beta-helix repeat-containing protein [Maritalea mobilis]